MIPSQERDEAIKHLVAAHWIMKEWAVRANLAESGNPGGHTNYSLSPQQAKAIDAAQDKLDELTETLRKL